MVSGKHSKTYDINKIHAFIDNLTSERSTPTYLETRQRLRQKKLFDEPVSDEKQVVPPRVEPPASGSCIPKGITPIKDESQKKLEETTVNLCPEEALLPEFELVDETPTPIPQNYDWFSDDEPKKIDTIWDKIEHEKEESTELRSFEDITTEAKPETETTVNEPTTEPTSPPLRERRRGQRLRQKDVKKRL
ncbi:MAG TPA: hypothetical protein VMT57_10000 [Candidatus Thermoplasmatota archaeon]|nr:hypothetical protein [Candidatus Thermoplasmatota archaeon]